MNSAFMLATDTAEEERLGALLGGDCVRFLSLAQRISWGVLQPELVRVDVGAVCSRLEREFPPTLPRHLLVAFGSAHLGREAEADAELEAARRLQDDEFGYLLPTDAEWRAEMPDAPLVEVDEGRVWRLATWFPYDHTRFLWSSVATIFRTESGGLALINPGEVDDARLAALAELGPVRWVFTPAGGHRRYVGQLRDRFPDARILGVPRHGTQPQTREVSFDGFVDGPTDLLPGELQVIPLRGRVVTDVQVFHVPTRSLVSTHMASVNLAEDAGSIFAGRLYAFCWGLHRRSGWLGYHLGMLRDLGAFQASIEEVLDTGFERVYPAHGGVEGITGDPLADFRRSLAWATSLDSSERGRMVRSYWWQQPGFLLNLIRFRLFGS